MNPGIEKCSSPTGDGNIRTIAFETFVPGLRNVVPRQGTETMWDSLNNKRCITIEKCSSPTGDGNKT